MALPNLCYWLGVERDNIFLRFGEPGGASSLCFSILSNVFFWDAKEEGFFNFYDASFPHHLADKSFVFAYHKARRPYSKPDCSSHFFIFLDDCMRETFFENKLVFHLVSVSLLSNNMMPYLHRFSFANTANFTLRLIFSLSDLIDAFVFNLVVS